MVNDIVISELVDALKQDPIDPNNTFSAVVSRIDDEGVVWVRLAGSEVETPTASTSAEVEPNDVVTVEWRNNKLYIAGNYSNPSAGAVRVDEIERSAAVARSASESAVADAQKAREAAESVEGIAEQAQEDASSAKRSAESASEYASRALGNLSTVQSVTETLNWITAHGTMTLTSDTALDPTHVYFVVDAQGDYVVGGTHYSVVTEPDVADISTYYELSIDESLNNYVGTHLAVTSEGLWLLPDANGNKVLIATGQGTTYTEAGTYIIETVEGADVVLARFTAESARMGSFDNGFLEIDNDSIVAKTAEGSEYFNIGLIGSKPTTVRFKKEFEGTFNHDPVNPSGTDAEHTYTFLFDDEELAKAYNALPVGSRVTARSTALTYYTRNGETGFKSRGFSFYHYFTKGTIDSARDDYFSMYMRQTELEFYANKDGMRRAADANRLWLFSVTFEVIFVIDAPAPAYTFGINTTSEKPLGFCVGDGTIASETGFSCGKYNKNDSSNQNAFIVGNGTSDDARSNAFTVDWTGKVGCGDYSGNFKSIFDIFYPKGSYYETDLPYIPPHGGAGNPTDEDMEELGDTWFDPNYAWGGTWSLESQGKVHVSAGSTYTVGTQYGSNTHTHSTGDFTLLAKHLPAHTHGEKSITGSFTIRRHMSNSYGLILARTGKFTKTETSGNAGTPTTQASGASSIKGDVMEFDATHTHSSVGGDTAHNHGDTGSSTRNSWQPSIAVYRWHRTA